MKKRITVMLLAFVLLLSIPAYALESRGNPIAMELSFDDTTANCAVVVSSANANFEITATVKLYRGNTCIKTWNASDSGYLDFSETYTVTKGYTYKLTADVTINGTTYPTVSTSRACS